jgi:hypothetical protein
MRNLLSKHLAGDSASKLILWCTSRQAKYLHNYFRATLIRADEKGRADQLEREEIACFLGGEREAKWAAGTKMGISSDIHRIIGIRADLVYSTRLKHLTNFGVLSTGVILLFWFD